jgi:hypothetical protein
VNQHASTERGTRDANQNGRGNGIVQRQAYRRTINTNIAFALPYTHGDELQLLCECGRHDCKDWLPVELNVYRAVRRRPSWRLVRAQHEQPDIDVIRRRYLAFNGVETTENALAQLSPTRPSE